MAHCVQFIGIYISSVISFNFANCVDGREDLEKAALLCLRMIEIALEKQEQFVGMFRSVPQQSSVLVSPLEDLLLSVNPRSSAPDYLLKIMK